MESRAGFLLLKEQQKLEREMNGYMNWICKAGMRFDYDNCNTIGGNDNGNVVVVVSSTNSQDSLRVDKRGLTVFFNLFFSITFFSPFSSSYRHVIYQSLFNQIHIKEFDHTFDRYFFEIVLLEKSLKVRPCESSVFVVLVIMSFSRVSEAYKC